MSSSSETSGESKVSSGELGRRRMRRGGRSAKSLRGGGPSSSSSSEVAVCAILCQVRTGEDGSERFEPIGCANKKFSDTARKWGLIRRKHMRFASGYITMRTAKRSFWRRTIAN
jgi:hypothetical protein